MCPASVSDRVDRWQPAVGGDRRTAALNAASVVAARLRDRALVAETIAAALAQSRYPRTVWWQPESVAQGDAGIALVCGQLDRCFPDNGWDRVAHGYLSAATRHAEGVRLPPAAFAGLSGLGFVAMMLGRQGTRYGRLTAAIEAELVPETHLLAEATLDRQDGLPVSEFDVVSGLAGIGAYLLAHRASPAMGSALKHALDALSVLLAGAGPDGVPRWWTPAEMLGDPTTVADHPNGALNCGLAHGIPGPLALLSLALSEGAPILGLSTATAAAADWLSNHRSDDAWGINWPTMVTLPDSRDRHDEPSRTAWCYGAPGVARSLWLAGTALGNDELRTLAVDAMAALYRRPVSARHIDAPTFCHGVAGLLQVTLRFWHDTQDPMFAAAATNLTDQLLDSYEPDASLLGFRAIEPGGHRLDHAGLLDGAPGVALVLLAAATDVEPSWDRLFLLS